MRVTIGTGSIYDFSLSLAYLGTVGDLLPGHVLGENLGEDPEGDSKDEGHQEVLKVGGDGPEGGKQGREELPGLQATHLLHFLDQPAFGYNGFKPFLRKLRLQSPKIIAGHHK